MKGFKCKFKPSKWNIVAYNSLFEFKKNKIELYSSKMGFENSLGEVSIVNPYKHDLLIFFEWEYTYLTGGILGKSDYFGYKIDDQKHLLAFKKDKKGYEMVHLKKDERFCFYLENTSALKNTSNSNENVTTRPGNQTIVLVKNFSHCKK